MKKFSKFITDHSIFIVIVSFLLLIPATIGYYNTKVNYDILSYLPEDNETIKGEKILTEEFKIGAFSFVMVDNMSNYDLLKLEEKIKTIDGVEQTISIADITDITLPKEMIPEEIVDKIYKEDETIILVVFSGSTSEEKTMQAVKELRNTVEDATKVSGMTGMVLDTRDLSSKEVFAYIIISVLLCFIVLTFATDSYLVPLFLLGNIGFAILYNMGTNILLGQISYITKAITAVLQLGVTMDFSIFLYHKYEQARKIEQNQRQAMQLAIIDTFKSVIGSSLTTIAGFLALCFMDLTLGMDIGIVMAKGVLCGLISVLTLFPALLLVFDRQIEKTKHKVYLPKFKKTQTLVTRHSIMIAILFLLLLIPAFIGNKNVEVYYKLDQSLPPDLASTLANNHLKEKFNIVSPELILLDKNMEAQTRDELIQKLKNIDGIDLVLAPRTILDFGIPIEMLPEELVKIMGNETYQLVIINSTYEVASKELENQIEKVNHLVKQYDKRAIVAGEGPLMNDLTTIAAHDFKMVNYASILVIFILMLLVLKSISLPFVLICAIEFAIFANMAIAYYSNTTLPFIASIVVGTIQLGATIDYAILMSTKYLEERKERKKKEAMKKTLETTIPSILVSACCFFAATFGVAIYSKIDMIASICNLLSRGAIISMLVVMLLLPTLLLLFDNIIIKTTKNMKDRDNMKKRKQYMIIGIISCMLINPISARALTKNETIYTNLDSNGNITNFSVTNHLFIKDYEKFDDDTELKEILNINGKEPFSMIQNKLQWQTSGKDIFYRGKTEKEQPIEVKIEYYLDGEKKQPKEMVGEKGNVKIIFTFQNKLKNEVIINGKTEIVYTPFVVTSAMVLDNKYNSNIEVINGKWVDSGSRSIVVGMSSPGLYESLKLEEFSGLNTITISYDTKKFSLGNIYMVATPKILEEKDFTIFRKMESFTSNMSKLQSSMNQIEEGIKKLENGSAQLLNGTNSLSNNLKTALASVTELKNGEVALEQGLEDTLIAINQVKGNIQNKDVTGSVSSLQQLKAANLNAITNILLQTGMDFVSLKSFYETNQLQNYVGTDAKLLSLKSAYELSYLLMANNEAIDQTIHSLNEISSNVNTLIATLEGTLKQLQSGSETISNGLIALENGMNQLSSGAISLLEGGKNLNDGVITISNGISTFNRQGINPLYEVSKKLNYYNSKLEVLANLSKEYKGYATKSADNTIFVYMIKSIK